MPNRVDRARRLLGKLESKEQDKERATRAPVQRIVVPPGCSKSGHFFLFILASRALDSASEGTSISRRNSSVTPVPIV